MTDRDTSEPKENMGEGVTRLNLIGYWAGAGTTGSWPSPADFVDLGWDQDDRDFVADYLVQGQVARSYMGFSPCRFCGKNNGDLELTDGTYVWPSGLAHYVADHGVRLPDEFVQHGYAQIESLEQAERDLEWWASATPPPSTAASGAPSVQDVSPSSQNRTVLDPPGRPVDELAVLEGRDAVVQVVEELHRELLGDPEEKWENNTLERFLDGFGALLGVIELSYVNTGRKVPEDAWVLVADTLRGARHQE